MQYPSTADVDTFIYPFVHSPFCLLVENVYIGCQTKTPAEASCDGIYSLVSLSSR